MDTQTVNTKILQYAKQHFENHEPNAFFTSVLLERFYKDEYKFTDKTAEHLANTEVTPSLAETDRFYMWYYWNEILPNISILELCAALATINEPIDNNNKIKP